MPDPTAFDHSGCNFAYKQVTCDRCRRQYICTPSDDLYCAAEDDHCCEACLLGAAGLRLAGEVLLGNPGEDPVVWEYDDPQAVTDAR